MNFIHHCVPSFLARDSCASHRTAPLGIQRWAQGRKFPASYGRYATKVAILVLSGCLSIWGAELGGVDGEQYPSGCQWKRVNSLAVSREAIRPLKWGERGGGVVHKSWLIGLVPLSPSAFIGSGTDRECPSPSPSRSVHGAIAPRKIPKAFSCKKPFLHVLTIEMRTNGNATKAFRSQSRAMHRERAREGERERDVTFCGSRDYERHTVCFITWIHGNQYKHSMNRSQNLLCSWGPNDQPVPPPPPSRLIARARGRGEPQTKKIKRI